MTLSDRIARLERRQCTTHHTGLLTIPAAIWPDDDARAAWICEHAPNHPVLIVPETLQPDEWAALASAQQRELRNQARRQTEQFCATSRTSQKVSESPQ